MQPKPHSTKLPLRQIRASHTPTTITVYQAYNSSIATAAVTHQKLNASPDFSTARMTWVKPSWAWMLYRSGYSYKDTNQSHIVAIELKRETFLSLLGKAVLAHGRDGGMDDGMRKGSVRVQWDPERTVRMEKLPWRSIQIGIPGVLLEEFMEGIVRIEDVTERARKLKRVLDEDHKGVSGVELVERGLVPEESEFAVDEGLRKILCMDLEEDVSK